MKSLFKYIGIGSVLLFSFYYTEKMSNMVINNSSLAIKINENIEEYNILPVSAEINGNYIIPGLNGNIVNVIKSYNNMKDLESFNSYYLIYDEKVPDISIENNKEKIIKNGNYLKNSVAIIVKDNQDIINYSKEKKIKITRLIDYNTFDKNALYEQINNDKEKYEEVEKLLNNNNINTKICFVNNNNIDICRENNNYLVDETISLGNHNLGEVKNTIKSGYIIFINDNVSIADYKILIRQIYYQDLDILSLSKLITEKRD